MLKCCFAPNFTLKLSQSVLCSHMWKDANRMWQQEPAVHPWPSPESRIRYLLKGVVLQRVQEDKVGNSVQPGRRENKGFRTQAVWPKRAIAEEGKTQDGYQRRLPGGENSRIGECLPRGKVGSSLIQNTGNQTEQNSSLSAAGRNPALKRMTGITRKAVLSRLTLISAI